MKPNILIIMADDLGVGDPGCYNAGSLAPTPHMDALARDGLLFTKAYCPDAICTPSRYSLLTGCYSWRTGRTHGGLLNWEPPMISKDTLTLPAMLKRVGYTTAGFGKWHLGADAPTTDGLPPVGQFTQRHPEDGINLDLKQALREGPLDRGFDTWYGFICSSESLVYEQGIAVATIDVYPHPKAPGVEELQHFELKDYLPEVTRRTISYLEDHVKRGEEAAPFFVYYSPYVPHVPLAVPPEFVGTTRAGAYGDYVAALDHYMGELLGAVDKLGLREDTLVIFCSDNGSQFVTTGDEGHRPNGDLNGRKGQVLEGGVRTPLITRWPGKIAPGTKSDRLVALADLMATTAEITGIELEESAACDSFSLWPVLCGNDEPGREELIMKAATAHFALRSGAWKYIAEPGFPLSGPAQPPTQHQLFNLDEDPGETHDLLSSQPEIARSMRSRLEAMVKTSRTAPISAFQSNPSQTL